MRPLLVGVMLAALTYGAVAQTPPAFEVASVRRSSITAGSFVKPEFEPVVEQRLQHQRWIDKSR